VPEVLLFSRIHAKDGELPLHPGELLFESFLNCLTRANRN
jgi:hypothetical protein